MPGREKRAPMLPRATKSGLYQSLPRMGISEWPYNGIGTRQSVGPLPLQYGGGIPLGESIACLGRVQMDMLLRLQRLQGGRHC